MDTRTGLAAEVPTEPGFYYIKLTGWFVGHEWNYDWSGERLHIARLSPNQNGVLFIEMTGQLAEPFEFWRESWRGEWTRIPDPDALARACIEAAKA